MCSPCRRTYLSFFQILIVKEKLMQSSLSIFGIICKDAWYWLYNKSLLEEKSKSILIIMLIVGQVSSQEEANEITFIAKLVVVGQRARFLASQQKK